MTARKVPTQTSRRSTCASPFSSDSCSQVPASGSLSASASLPLAAPAADCCTEVRRNVGTST